MKRITLLTVLVACGLIATSTPVFAQATTESSNWFTGKVNLFLLGRDDVSSSKFEEYRVMPKGVSMPVLTLMGSHNGSDFALLGRNVSRDDQRYTGWAKVNWIGVSFDYNQIPHNMGNDGHTFLSETAPGVWSMSATLRKTLGDAVDATLPATARNYAFYAPLLAPTIASAGSVDISGLRRRGDVEVDLGGNLPFDLAITYMRELKTGARGASGGDILGVVTSAVDVLEPLDEVTQDFGVRWAYTFKSGDVHARFNRNIYNNRVDALIIDNPFRATDLAYVSTAVPGGPAQVRFSTSPDNEASRGTFGAFFKFARQTRISADVAFGTWTQDAQFLPFTINSAIFTPTGASATSTSVLPQQSLNGKINTTNVNVGFVSRPVDGLGIRLRLRRYELTNKTTPVVWTGSTSGSPDRSWGAPPTGGWETANLYDTTTTRFDAQVSYDIRDLTIEGAARAANFERTHREATSGDENGFNVAAVYHTSDWVSFRAFFDNAKRTAEGETFYGFQADEAERESKRGGLEVTITPHPKFGFGLSYFRRNDDYTNRPDRVAASGGVPIAGAQPIPDTPSGLLEASYDTYTVDFEFTPSERAEISAFYTYEKNASTNQFSTTTGVNLNNKLNYAGTDRGDTFGVNAKFDLVPEKWTFSLMAQSQRVDGLMDITAREAGAFYTPGRTTLVPPGAGGALDITDFDDTERTTAVADLAYAVSESWTFSVGYAYDKYTYADAFTSGTTIFPQSVLFFLKADDGGYEANIVYTKLNYRW